MAVSLAHDCPHCLTKRIGFRFVGQAFEPSSPTRRVVFFLCNKCGEPLAVTCFLLEGVPELDKADGDLVGFTYSCFYYPKEFQSKVPKYLPQLINRAFEQADIAIHQGSWEAAVAMDRRALELATKEKAPDQSGLKLYKRIEFLAAEGKLTPSLKDWAHSVRAVGNDAVHDEDELSEDEAHQAHELTRFILTYLYTLPEQVRLAQERRDQG